MKISLSKYEWLRVGTNQGWIVAKNTNEFEKAKEEAILVAKKIQNALRQKGLVVSKIKELNNGRQLIREVNGYRVDIEVKPWANDYNKNFEMRYGIRIMIGGYADKYFRRKRFGAKNLERIVSYIEGVVRKHEKTEETRERSREYREIKKEQKMDIARQEYLARTQHKEAKIKTDPIKEKVAEEEYAKELPYGEKEWRGIFQSEIGRPFLDKLLKDNFHMGERVAKMYSPHNPFDVQYIDFSSLKELEEKSGLSFAGNLRKRNFILFLDSLKEIGGETWIFQHPQGRGLIEWARNLEQCIDKHREREEWGSVKHDPILHEKENLEIQELKRKEEEAKRGREFHPFEILPSLANRKEGVMRTSENKKLRISKAAWLLMAKEAHWFRRKAVNTFQFAGNYHETIGLSKMSQSSSTEDVEYVLKDGIIVFKATGTPLFGVKDQIRYDVPEFFSSVEEANSFLRKIVPQYFKDTGGKVKLLTKDKKVTESIGSIPEQEGSDVYVLRNGLLKDVNDEDVFSISELSKYKVPVFEDAQKANAFLANLEEETGRKFGRVDDVEFKADWQDIRGRDTYKARQQEKLKEIEEQQKRWKAGDFT